MSRPIDDLGINSHVPPDVAAEIIVALDKPDRDLDRLRLLSEKAPVIRQAVARVETQDVELRRRDAETDE